MSHAYAKPNKKVFICIVSFVCTIAMIFVFAQAMNIILASQSELQYFTPFVEQAIEYVRTQTNASERYGYGEALKLENSKRTVRYEKKANFNSLEEFEACVEELDVYVEVNDRATCVVVFEKREEDDKLIITRYFWE